MGKTTVADIVKETVEAIWDELHQIHMPIPTTESLKRNAKKFYDFWNFPHVVGCLDGKHVRLICPSNSGSMFYNYKQYFSLVFQALVDADYKYIVVDVGGYGKQSDGGTFLASDLFNFINSDLITFPEPDILPHSQIEAPFVILADEAYPLLPYLMKPYKRDGLTERKRRFNDRLSRARKTVECSFGITYSKWRILSKSIETSVDFADKIVKCICVLHNIVLDKEGLERHLTDVHIGGHNVSWERRGRPPTQAENVRDIFAQYFEKYPLSYV